MLWVSYRLLIASYYTIFVFGLLVYSLITDPSLAAYTYIYLTQWTLTLIIIYMVVASINVLVDRKHGRCYHTSDVSDLTIIGRFINEGPCQDRDMVLCMMFSDIALVEFVLEDQGIAQGHRNLI